MVKGLFYVVEMIKDGEIRDISHQIHILHIHSTIFTKNISKINN